MFQPQPSTHPFHRSPFPISRPHSVGPESRKSFSLDSSGEYSPRKPPPQPLYTRRMTIHFPKEEPDTTYLYGYVLLAGTFVMFVISMYAIVVSKFVPDTGNKTLDWIKHDEYYCLLVPISLFSSFYFVLWSWMGMKFFRHN